MSEPADICSWATFLPIHLGAGNTCAKEPKSTHTTVRPVSTTVDDLMKYLREAGFAPVGFASTLVRSQPGAPQMEPAQLGLVPDAGFVCILAQKP